MVQIKRLLIKRFGLPILCIIFVFMFLKPSTLYWAPVGNENELVMMLQSLHRAQLQNRILLVQTDNISLSHNLESVRNHSTELSEQDKHKKTIRKWFDDRPGANSSKMAASSHPFFPGYIIENPDLCKGGDVDILLYLHSAAEHRDSRRQIRESWGSHRTFLYINIKLLFIVGKPNNKLSQYQLETEFATYGDILQGNFSDTFKNLTYKAITMVTWVNEHCVKARYIMKVDDDMFVDMYRVISELVPKIASKKSAVACDVKTNMVVSRDHHVKWYVNENLLPGRVTWPEFCSGYFLILTGETIPELYEASFSVTQFIPIDDAYLFGLLVEKNISLEFINIHDQISVNQRPDPDKEISVNGKFEFISFRVRSQEDHSKLWTLRSNKLSSWEQNHSRYFKSLHDSKSRTMVV